MAAVSIPGIHHVTAIAGDPRRNIDFYTEVLGLRLVKKTVNFDDPGTYHLYYGDRTGRPGTILSFFPWPRAPKGRKGFGQPRAVSFAIPLGSIDYWSERLAPYGAGAPRERWEETVISLQDPDGLDLELVAASSFPEVGMWDGSPVPPERAIRGLHGVTLWVLSAAPSIAFLTQTLGFTVGADSGERVRLTAPGGEPGAGGAVVVDVIEAGDALRATVGVGNIHHVAFRAAGGPEQAAWRGLLLAGGVEVTPIVNRQYFHSIYFHEPGGVLLEVATDPPGFTLDEDVEELGTHLKLPPQYEAARTKIEAFLPPLEPEGRALKEG